MDINQVYSQTHRLDNFSAYNVPREYYNTREVSILSKSKSSKQVGNYITGIQKLAKETPGPGKYSINPETSPKKPAKKIDFKSLQKNGKKTYLDKLIKDKQKVPDVGKYNIYVDKTQRMRQKYRQKGDLARAKAPLFRPTVLDQINRDNMRISPADYGVIKPLGYKSMRGAISPEHKRSMSLPKLPGAADYNPIPQSFETFTHRSMQKKIHRPIETVNTKSHKKSQSFGPGPKYSLISTWAVSKDKSGKMKGRNMFKSVSNLKSPGIYH